MKRLLPRLFAAVFFLVVGGFARAGAAPAATPSPPPVTIGGALTGFTIASDNPNASGALDTQSGADLSSRTQLSNALLTIAAASGKFRFNAIAGAYAFPVVGQAINPTFQSGVNTNLYGSLPNAYAQYLPNGNWTISAGELPTLLGQENTFTFQNINIQRGLVWNVEPVVSNGVRVTYSNATFTGTLELNDGYFSKKYRALEGLVGWTPAAGRSLQFAFIVPDADTPGNPTSAIGNKREYDLMYSQQIGKLQLLPYALWIVSPASGVAGYVRTETAFGAVMLANYAFNDSLSLGARFESLANGSSPQNFTFNADFLGYGPGSSATTYTLTPTYRASHMLVRAEWSYVSVSRLVPALGFGANGTAASQTRFGFEAGLQF